MAMFLINNGHSYHEVIKYPIGTLLILAENLVESRSGSIESEHASSFSFKSRQSQPQTTQDRQHLLKSLSKKG